MDSLTFATFLTDRLAGLLSSLVENFGDRPQYFVASRLCHSLVRLKLCSAREGTEAQKHKVNPDSGP